MSEAPPTSVQSAFRCQKQPVCLPGGQGETFRCGDVVLKPCRNVIEANWIARIHREIQQVGFRLPQPVQPSGGEWIVDGWEAWTFVGGHHSRERWGEVLAACRTFHHTLGNVSKPAFLDKRDDPFSRADRIAWGEERADCHPHLLQIMQPLQSLVEPVNLPSQIIHGDFTENVLFEEGHPPAVIDLSPFWRPADYALAIVLVDALDWCGADESIFQWVGDIPAINQLMVRAELFRIAVYDGFHKQGVDALGAAEGHLKTIEVLTHRINASRAT